MININSDKLIQFPIELLLLIIALSTNLLKDLLNPDLVRVIEKNKFYKYIILFLLAHISSSFYLKKYDKNATNPIHLLWSLAIVVVFYLFNKLNYKFIILFSLGFIILYGLKNINNYYKYYN